MFLLRTPRQPIFQTTKSVFQTTKSTLQKRHHTDVPTVKKLFKITGTWSREQEIRYVGLVKRPYLKLIQYHDIFIPYVPKEIELLDTKYCYVYNHGPLEIYEAGYLHCTLVPAVIYPNGVCCWYLNGLLDRTGLPAIEYPDGTKKWFKKGLLHRRDGPAILYPNGYKEYYENGILINIDGPYVRGTDYENYYQNFNSC